MSRDAARRSHSLADEVTAETRAAAEIYGVIVSSAVMATAHRESVWNVAAAVLVTLVIYWAAERYAHVMANRIAAGSGYSWSGLQQHFSRGWELVTASFIPLLVMLAAYLLGASLSVSILAALMASTGILAVAGWQAGVAARMRLPQRVLSAVVAATFGLAMILLKTLLH